MPNLIDFAAYRAVLCLHGKLPEREFFVNAKLPIVAADGAANVLHALGISPNIIIGDLDSVTETASNKSEIIYRPEQDLCDFNKALEYLQTADLLPAIIVGISGGCLDHVLNNINIFLHSNSLLYAPPLLGQVLRAGTKHVFSFPTDTKISIIGMPKAIISSHGLKWELHNHELSFPGTNSCFNRMSQPETVLSVHQGLALVLIYTEETLDAGQCYPNKT